MRTLMTFALGGILVAALAVPAHAGTPFNFELNREDLQRDGEEALVEVPLSAAQAVGLAPPSQVDAENDHFFAYLNGTQEQFAGPNQPNCSGAVVDEADCFSFFEWAERSLSTILIYEPFQLAIQAMLDGIADDPATPFTDPILDESMALPLIGDFNLGMYLQDLWDDTGAGCNTNPAAGPQLLENPTLRIGCKYDDDDDAAIDLIGEVLSDPNNYDFFIRPTGALDGGAEMDSYMGAKDDHEGSIEVIFTLNVPFSADVIFRQPDYPNHVTSGYYMHGAGKLQINNLRIEAEVYTIGGNLRAVKTEDVNSASAASAGYSIGLGLDRLLISGEIGYDTDGYNCTQFTESDWRVAANGGSTAVCDASKLDPGHPEFGNQSAYEAKVNSINETLGQFAKYMEVALFYEGVRAASTGVGEYLTAMEILDLQGLSHTVTNGTVYDPVLTHPLDGNTQLYLDYGLFYRFNGEQAQGIDIVGGFGLEITYPEGANCDALDPAPPGPRYPDLPEVPLPFDATKGGKESMVSIGVHLDPLNMAIDQMWEERFLCTSIWKENDAGIGQFLKGDTFSLFVPSLSSKLNTADMMMRVVPRFVSPDSAPAEYDPNVDQVEVTYKPADPPVCDDPMTAGSTRPCWRDGLQWDPADPEAYAGPYDIRVRMPHLELQFLTNENNDGIYANYVPIFGVETEVNLYLGVGYYKTASDGYFPADANIANNPCYAVNGPCRIARVNMHVDTQLKNVYDYNGSTYLVNADLSNSLSSIVAGVLNLAADFEGEFMINTADQDVFGFAIDPAEPTSGPMPPGGQFFRGTAFEATDVSNPPDGQDEFLGIFLNIGDLIGGVHTIGGKDVGFGYDANGDVISNSPDGYADVFSPALIMELLASAGLFDLALAPGALDVRPSQVPQIVDNHLNPETFWAIGDIAHGMDIRLDEDQVRRLGMYDGQVLLSTAALTQDDMPSRTQFRINGGAFQLSAGNYVKVPFLLDGHHTIEAWNIDNDGYIDPIPATLDFTIDRLAPRIEWVGEPSLLGVGGDVRLGLSVKDIVAEQAELDVAWRLDDGEWQSVAADGIVDGRAPAGRHTLQVRAIDPHGNENVRTIDFVSEGGFGCTAGTGGDPIGLLILMLPIILLRSRRRADAN